jgi:hypothetical protein
MEEMEETEAHNGSGPDVRKWGRIEITFESSEVYQNPIQDVALQVLFTSPSGAATHVMGFWDGSTRFRARFSPEEEGLWTYVTFCSDMDNGGLHNREGDFVCGPADTITEFDEHGPIRLSGDHSHFIHADQKPFFWLADTAWNGCLLSSKDEWRYYLSERVRQGFTAVQWVATPWRSAPTDREGQKAFEGVEKIKINPRFFQRLDEWLEMTYDVGLLNAPVLLWTHHGGKHPEMNPGVGLPEDQLILLAEYMVARWACYPVVWILGGDGKYDGELAERWKKVGSTVFGRGLHAPVAMHVVGQSFPVEEFRNESWMDILGYQSGHGDNDKTLQWIVTGPPAEDWKKRPRQFYMNMEPAYENHVAYHSKKPHDAASVRMAIYWSLLNAPTAGVTYGGHGVWGWDDGKSAPMDHPSSGTPLPWRDALIMEGAEQMRHLRDAFETVDWWQLRPAPELLAEQPGEEDVHDHILISKSDANNWVVAYTPQGKAVKVKMAGLPERLGAVWYNPRTGEPEAAIHQMDGDVRVYETPDECDWLLVMA